MIEKLGGFLRPVVVLHHLDRETLFPQTPEHGDIVEDQHVAVHEERPTVEGAEVRDEEPREGKIG